MSNTLSRRAMLAGTGAITLGSHALAQTPARAAPPSTITNPPRQWGRDAAPQIYPDPDIINVDPVFKDLIPGNTALHRVATGFEWAEGPAWCAQGRFLLFSDVQADVQYRYIWETGQTTPYRKPSFNSNGNTFDFQGRQVSTQDFFRRVIRWEHDGTMTTLADAFEGKPLNSPNDLVPHPDGSIWFTDPPYGDQISEGHPDFAGGPSNPDGLFKPLVGAPEAGVIGGKSRALPTNVYRIDPGGRVDIVITEEQVPDPNGLCFSPDYKTLYVISTGKGPGDKIAGGKGNVFAFDVQGAKLSGQRVFSDMMVDGINCGPDGMRADVAGNLWISSAAPLGYAGVTVWNPGGKLIGRLRLPEICANLTFGGPKRDHLFMCASQSLYMLRLDTQGAAPG